MNWTGLRSHAFLIFLSFHFITVSSQSCEFNDESKDFTFNFNHKIYTLTFEKKNSESATTTPESTTITQITTTTAPIVATTQSTTTQTTTTPIVTSPSVSFEGNIYNETGKQSVYREKWVRYGECIDHTSTVDKRFTGYLNNVPEGQWTVCPGSSFILKNYDSLHYLDWSGGGENVRNGSTILVNGKTHTYWQNEVTLVVGGETLCKTSDSGEIVFWEAIYQFKGPP